MLHLNTDRMSYIVSPKILSDLTFDSLCFEWEFSTVPMGIFRCPNGSVPLSQWSFSFCVNDGWARQHAGNWRHKYTTWYVPFILGPKHPTDSKFLGFVRPETFSELQAGFVLVEFVLVEEQKVCKRFFWGYKHCQLIFYCSNIYHRHYPVSGR